MKASQTAKGTIARRARPSKRATPFISADPPAIPSPETPPEASLRPIDRVQREPTRAAKGKGTSGAARSHAQALGAEHGEDRERPLPVASTAASSSAQWGAGGPSPSLSSPSPRGCNTAGKSRPAGRSGGSEKRKIAQLIEFPIPGALREEHRGGTAFPLDSGGSVEALRAALDWVDVLWLCPADYDAWDRLCDVAGGVQHLKHEELVVPCNVRRQAGGDLVLQGPGVYVMVRDPYRCDERASGSGSQLSAVQLQVQGLALSSVLGGGRELVRAMRCAVEALLFPEAGATSEERSAVCDPFTRMGRVDVAIDCWFRGPEADAWVDEEIFASGHHDQATERWSTRARGKKTIRGSAVLAEEGAPEGGPTRMEGSRPMGRSVYVGGGVIEVCTYERDKKQDGDWPVLEATYRALGWDDTGRVIRREIRCKRAWYRDQKFQVNGEAVEGDKLTFDQWMLVVDDQIAAMVHRFRHTAGTTQRRKDRPSSVWQQAVEDGVQRWSERGGDYRRVLAFKREVAVERAMRAACYATARIAGAEGISKEEALERIRVYYAGAEPALRQKLDAVKQRAAERYAIPDLALLEAEGVEAAGAAG